MAGKSYPVVEIEGIGPSSADKLHAAGIKTTAKLLQHCATRSGRKNLAQQTGVEEKKLLAWANMADLMRISGVGTQYSELLERAGVDTVKELRTRNATNLAAKMAEVNAAKKLTRTVPSASLCAKWVEQAKAMDPVIEY